MRYWCWRPKDNSYRNFGDELTGLLLDKLLPGQSHQRVEPEQAQLIGVGSVINTLRGRLQPGTAIWGAGGGYHPEDITEGLEVLAVRGSLTRDLCGLPADTVMGDPAFLLPLWYPPAKDKPHKFGLVRHMGDSRDLGYLKPDIVIKSTELPLDVIERITSCRFIISSGLHGWIVAMAYGIPSICLPLDDGNKFADFVGSLDRPLEQIQQDLLKSFSEWATRHG
jgi:pyruvyltransferase